MEYLIIGLARIRFALLGAVLWMFFMFSLVSLGYNGFFDTWIELLIVYPLGLGLTVLGICIDEYCWDRFLKAHEGE